MAPTDYLGRKKNVSFPPTCHIPKECVFLSSTYLTVPPHRILQLFLCIFFFFNSCLSISILFIPPSPTSSSFLLILVLYPPFSVHVDTFYSFPYTLFSPPLSMFSLRFLSSICHTFSYVIRSLLILLHLSLTFQFYSLPRIISLSTSSSTSFLCTISPPFLTILLPLSIIYPPPPVTRPAAGVHSRPSVQAAWHKKHGGHTVTKRPIYRPPLSSEYTCESISRRPPSRLSSYMQFVPGARN